MGRNRIYTDAAQRARVHIAVARLLAEPSKSVIVRRGEDDAAHIVRRLAKQGHTARAEQVGGVWVVILESEAK